MRDRIVPLVSVVALALAWLGGGTALAAGTAVDAAITVFAEVGGDKVKLAAFCEMTRLMSEDPDLPKDDGVYRRIDVAMNTLGAEFQQVWNLGAELEPDSPAEKAYDAAVGELEGKCKN